MKQNKKNNKNKIQNKKIKKVIQKAKVIMKTKFRKK